MALFHFTVDQTKRSEGQSAIASAAYRSGEKLYSEYYGEYSDYTRKGGVICSEILLPPHAPPEYADRQTLWNAVEKAERGKNAQLAYSFEISFWDVNSQVVLWIGFPCEILFYGFKLFWDWICIYAVVTVLAIVGIEYSKRNLSEQSTK